MRTTRCVLIAIAFAVACTEAAPDDVDGFGESSARLTEELRIDGHAEDLVPIGTLAVRGDGTIALNQAQDGRLRFYSPSGDLVGSIGRQGEGPGEFQNPYRLGWNGDTLWVIDGRLRRVTFVSPEFTVVGMISNIASAARPAPADSGRIPEFPFAYPQAVGPDSSFYVGFGLAVNQVVPEPYSGRMTLGRMTPDGVIHNVLLFLPQNEGGGVTTPEGGSASVPFGNSPVYQIAPHAGRAAVAMASLDGPDAGTFSLTVAGLDGDTLFTRRYRFEAEPLPQSVADSAIQERIERLRGFSASLAEAVRRDATVPPLYPPLESLVIGNDGSIWIEQRQTDEGKPYYVVRPDGEPMGTVLLPPRSRVGAATLDRAWVIQPDELDVQSVVRYAVAWP